MTKSFPAYSGDLNPIENCWRALRAELNRTVPPTLERRRDFVRRLHTAVRSVNRRYGVLFQYFTQNMNLRADAVLRANGGRTKY